MTVGELRQLLMPLMDECPVVVSQEDGGGEVPVMGATITFKQGEGRFSIHVSKSDTLSLFAGTRRTE